MKITPKWQNNIPVYSPFDSFYSSLYDDSELERLVFNTANDVGAAYYCCYLCGKMNQLQEVKKKIRNFHFIREIIEVDLNVKLGGEE